MKQSFLYLLTFIFVLQGCSSGDQPPSANYMKLSGRTMGTTYHITYSDGRQQNYQSAIDSLLEIINLEVSTYIEQSTISRFNQADSLFNLGYNPRTQRPEGYPNGHFTANYMKAREVYSASDGYFDPTIMPLVNYWGFGYSPKKTVEAVDSLAIDSLIAFVGFDKIGLAVEGKDSLLTKTAPGVQLDFSALAKGYGVDAVGRLLAGRGVEHFMVEIGGEVAAHGQSPRGGDWKIGINVPREDAGMQEIQTAVPLHNRALATSGNYRNFYEVNGTKYSHTINPFTGFPERSTLLSASVFAPDCMTADAYATAFMAMGLDKAFALASRLPEIEGYFLFNQEDGTMGVRYTEGLRPLFEKEEDKQ
ncbi:MAG: FAD:protein FMN transferase [Phaeodactylibacter sp.]|nr:FAD:protein FMN transferase [Phaeodactylibacter sp.]MCB9266563.1 FAD:protein FMN transferase [Lewinellaceae bacterium]MCB9288637.1 FAD:protein FMN transferase [Lewinellaceae bacterium]